jgi:glucose uptake protein GlcU
VIGLIILLVANWRSGRRQQQEVGTTSVALAFAMGLLGGLSRKR